MHTRFIYQEKCSTPPIFAKRWNYFHRMKLYSGLMYIVIMLMNHNTLLSVPSMAFGIPHFLNDS